MKDNLLNKRFRFDRREKTGPVCAQERIDILAPDVLRRHGPHHGAHFPFVMEEVPFMHNKLHEIIRRKQLFIVIHIPYDAHLDYGWIEQRVPRSRR